jgi:hypothetical protein
MATRKKKFDLSKLNLSTKIFIVIAVIIALAIILSGVPQTAQFYKANIGAPSQLKAVYSVNFKENANTVTIMPNFGKASPAYVNIAVIAKNSEGTIVASAPMSATGTARLDVAKTAFPVYLSYVYTPTNQPLDVWGICKEVELRYLCPENLKPVTTINYMPGQVPTTS